MVQWIKIAVDMFDNRKIKQIESMPEGDALVVIWVKLLCLAGNVNDYGHIYFTQEVPYTEQMLATEFGRPLVTIQLALRTFERFGMIEIIDDILHISNWERYQNIEGMEKIKEQNRKRQKKFYDKKHGKLPNVRPNVSITEPNATDIEEEKEEEIELEEDKEKIHSVDFTPFVNAWNELADDLNLARITKLNDKRRKKLKARLKEHKAEGFSQALDEIRNSDFLQGKTGGWKVSFDWLVENETNIQKVLEGNYRGKKLSPTEVLASTFVDEDDWRY